MNMAIALFRPTPVTVKHAKMPVMMPINAVTWVANVRVRRRGVKLMRTAIAWQIHRRSMAGSTGGSDRLGCRAIGKIEPRRGSIDMEMPSSPGSYATGGY